MDEEELKKMFGDMGNLTLMAVHLHEIYIALQDGGFSPSEALYIVTQMLTHDWSDHGESD